MKKWAAVKCIFAAGCLAISLPTSAISAVGEKSYVPVGGYIKDKDVALKVAEAILDSVYGTDLIAKEKPLVVSLKGNVWTINGTLKAGYKGGVAEIRISKTSGKVLYLNHEK